jgi:PAS domain S-box-containing protein
MAPISSRAAVDRNATITGNYDHLEVLLIEDSPSDAWLIDQQLREGSGDSMHVTTVTNLAQALDATANRHFDAALLDLNLPDSQGLATFEGLHAAAPGLPLVVLSGVANADIALAVLRKGAQDCILKRELPGALLDRIVRLAIERQRLALELDSRFEQLKLNEIRIRETIEESREAFVAFDDRGTVTFANDAAATMLTRTIDQMVGNPFTGEVPAGGPVDVAIQRTDGSQGLGELRLIGKTSGNTGGSLLSLRDVTERRRADAAIHDNEFRLRALLEHSLDSILLVDVRGQVKYASPSVAKITGYEDYELVDIDILAFMFADDMDEHRRLHNELGLQPQRSQTVKWRFRHKRGAMLYFEGVVTNLLDAPAIGGIVVNFRDETERHRIEETRRQSQKMEALGTLAGGIAHDFNNILLAIVGNTRLAIESLPEGNVTRQNLDEVDKASRRATDLVRRILSFSRHDAPQREAIDLQTILDEVVKLLRATLPAAIELQIKSNGSASRALADATQVHQVILNLATNAAHAIGDRPGRIEIEIDNVVLDEQTAATIGDLRAGRYVRVSMTDTGSGIDAQTLPRIFEPFFTTKSKGQGTGLGLSVVHGIMLEHEGAISAYSEVGKGSVFRLYLPATSAAPTVRESDTVAPIGHGECILYVDDEEAIVFLAKRVLHRLGYQVTAYADPIEALREFKLDPNKYDAVVSDLSMPGMSGFRLAQEIRAIKSTTPLILTSGYIRQEDREQAARLNVSEIILKPNTVDALGAALHRCLQTKLKT